jgi:hypothetical protein
MNVFTWLKQLFSRMNNRSLNDLYRIQFEETKLAADPSTNLSRLGDTYTDPAIQKEWLSWAASEGQSDLAW